MASGVETAPQSSPSIWMFLAADSVCFGIFFLVFMVERLGQRALFAESAHLLDARLGLINTLILITGSWLVALAVTAGRRGEGQKTRRLLLAAISVSSCFAIIKIFEYTTKISAGITPMTNDFFTFYFALTGVHFVHYTIGMAVLIYLATVSVNRVGVDKRYAIWLESGALFWHLVDLLWMFLFAMLYLLGVPG